MTDVIGLPRVATARRVMDRFAAVDGALLAAGIAYNAVLALIPIGLLASGLAGLLLTDPASRVDLIRSIATYVPPLAGVIDEIVAGLARASPSLSILGLVLAAWGTSRLFASLESAVARLDEGAPRRSLARRTAWRLGSIAVISGGFVAALVVAPALAIAVEIVGEGSGLRAVLDLLLALLPPLVGAVALAAVYRLVPSVRPSWRALLVPAATGAIVLVVVTRVFIFVAPRIFGANLVYGTLGAILIGLTWLRLVFTIVLIGAAWVLERSTATDAPVA